VKRVQPEASFGKPEERKSLGTTGIDNTIKIYLKEKGSEVVDWIRLAWNGASRDRINECSGVEFLE
jgi:hypothetical protein